MRLTIAPRGILQVDDAIIIFKNFEGRGDKYNRQGDRNFALLIEDEETAEALIREGWNVTVKPPRDMDDEPFRYLKVKVKFNDRGPTVYVKSGGNMKRLTEDTVSALDYLDIASVDLDIRPYDWTMRDGKSGRTAYLQSIHVTQNIDRFAARYAEEEYPTE